MEADVGAEGMETAAAGTETAEATAETAGTATAAAAEVTAETVGMTVATATVEEIATETAVETVGTETVEVTAGMETVEATVGMETVEATVGMETVEVTVGMETAEVTATAPLLTADTTGMEERAWVRTGTTTVLLLPSPLVAEEVSTAPATALAPAILTVTPAIKCVARSLAVARVLVEGFEVCVLCVCV